MPTIDATTEGKHELFEKLDYFATYSKCDRYCLESIDPSYKRRLKYDKFTLPYFINLS